MFLWKNLMFKSSMEIASCDRKQFEKGIELEANKGIELEANKRIELEVHDK